MGLSKKNVCVCMCVFLMVVGEDYKVCMCEFVCMIGGGGVITKYSREQIHVYICGILDIYIMQCSVDGRHISKYVYGRTLSASV